MVTGVPVEPRLPLGGNIHAVTDAGGSPFTLFPAQPCCQLTIGNHTGFDVEVQQFGTGDAFPVFNGTYFTFYGIADASNLGVRRIDQSGSQVSVAARWES